MILNIMTRVAPIALLLLAACQPGQDGKNTTTEKDDAGASVTITDPWCRPTPAGARTAACYVTIRASTANRLTGAATPLAAEIQVHDMSTEGGVMRMTPLPDGLALPAGERVKLEPGGRHLMLTGLNGPLVEGTGVALTLTFSQTPAMTVEASVRQP